jgi:hypothetical protein
LLAVSCIAWLGVDVVRSEGVAHRSEKLSSIHGIEPELSEMR